MTTQNSGRPTQIVKSLSRSLNLIVGSYVLSSIYILCKSIKSEERMNIKRYVCIFEHLYIFGIFSSKYKDYFLYLVNHWEVFFQFMLKIIGSLKKLVIYLTSLEQYNERIFRPLLVLWFNIIDQTTFSCEIST